MRIGDAWNMYRISDRNKLNEVERFAKWLTKKQETLGFSQEALARAIGKDKKTVSRYLNGENRSLPSEKIQHSIFEFISHLEKCGEYDRRKSEQFGELLSEILKALNITQQQLADMIGKDQRTVSNYTYGNINSFAGEQFEILYCLYRSVTFEYGTPESNLGTASKLEHILFGDRGDYGQYTELELLDNDDAVCYSDLIDYFDSLSPNVQVQILRHYRAFFEQTNEQLENGVTAMLSSYAERTELMNRFRKMTDDERSEMVYEFEQNSIMTFPNPNDAEEVSYFSAVSDMRTLVTDDEYHDALKAYREKPRSSEKNKNRYLFEQLICKHGIMPESLDELKMKLTFTGYEWYVWSLFLIYSHNDEGDFE